MLPFLRGHWIPTDIQLNCQRMQSDAGSVISESTWWKLYINMAACTLGSLVKAFHEERQSCWSVTNLRSTRRTTCELMCLCSFRPCSCQYSVSGHCLFRKWTTKKCSTHCQSSTGPGSDVYVGNVFKTCHIWQFKTLPASELPALEQQKSESVWVVSALAPHPESRHQENHHHPMVCPGSKQQNSWWLPSILGRMPCGLHWPVVSSPLWCTGSAVFICSPLGSPHPPKKPVTNEGLVRDSRI